MCSGTREVVAVVCSPCRPFFVVQVAKPVLALTGVFVGGSGFTGSLRVPVSLVNPGDSGCRRRNPDGGRGGDRVLALLAGEGILNGGDARERNDRGAACEDRDGESCRRGGDAQDREGECRDCGG